MTSISGQNVRFSINSSSASVKRFVGKSADVRGRNVLNQTSIYTPGAPYHSLHFSLRLLWFFILVILNLLLVS